MTEAEHLLDGFDEWIEAEIAHWNVPGAAVAVIYKGEVILCKGYGLRDVAEKLPVTEETLFAIGSCSKAFAAFDIALLTQEGKLNWDTPVRTYLPSFKLYDPVASEQATPRDLCSHRTGLPRHDLAWYGSRFSRKELFDHLQYLKPNKPFRYAYEYQNLMFMTAGYLVGEVAGTSWEDFTQKRVFDRLGMTSSNFSVTVSEKAENAALPYELKGGKAEAVPFRNLDAVAPAGAINSNVVDMLKWLKLHMNGDESILPNAELRRMHAPHTVTPITPDLPWSQFTEVENTSYALGWATQTYRGHTMVRHTGGIDGFIAWVSFMPHDDIGIILLTNLGTNTAAPVIHYHLYDRLLGLEPLPWRERLEGFFNGLKEKGEAAKQKLITSAKPSTSPSHALADYTGSYQHPGYGTLTIQLEGEKLKAAINGAEFALEHHHYDSFRLSGSDGDNDLLLLVSFVTDSSGTIREFHAGFEANAEPIVFVR